MAQYSFRVLAGYLGNAYRGMPLSLREAIGSITALNKLLIAQKGENKVSFKGMSSHDLQRYSVSQFSSW